MLRYFLLYLLAGLPLAAEHLPVRGIYSHPKAFWDKGGRLDEYGINSVFVHSGSITKELIERARTEGARVYAEFATLNGKGYVEKHPAAWPIDASGEKSPPASWFQGVCPTDAGFRAYRMNQLEELLSKHDIEGVWMDYVHWHAQFEEPDPILPETCFSESCINAFQQAKGIRVPAGKTAERARWILANHDGAWREWRCSVVNGWARDIRERMDRKRPGLLLGIYYAPWKDEEFASARRRILGLDLKALAGIVDVFSPMVYHGRMGRSPEWVGDYVRWTGNALSINRSRPPWLWPIVQAHGEPRAISPDEFGRVLALGSSGQSSGVMMFTIGAVAADPAKMQVLKTAYTEAAKPIGPAVTSHVVLFDPEKRTEQMIWSGPRHFEAPNWSPDGKYLLLNSGGKLWRLGIQGGEPEAVNSGSVNRINNDHGISADGKWYAISAGPIYIMPSSGGAPRQVTAESPSYYHGWSPDGKRLAYCARRQNNFDLYDIPVDGGAERRLTAHAGYDDGPDYTPDGKWIYFNSDRSGSWDVWRIPSGGAGTNDGLAERITSDDWEDWFPHPSPDGKWIVFLSFQKGTKGHPPNQHVLLRRMPLAGGPIEVLAKLFGGQGTINVNSWSPDSRRFAFVRYEVAR
jgi:Tol biopolymer transport system component